MTKGEGMTKQKGRVISRPMTFIRHSSFGFDSEFVIVDSSFLTPG
jgi:hypothetical protein